MGLQMLEGGDSGLLAFSFSFSYEDVIVIGSASPDKSCVEEMPNGS